MKMEIIYHRRNTIKLLNETPYSYGVEVDIRSYGKDLIIHHDPYIGGELFCDWLKSYKHGTLILNVKEDGLEGEILNQLKLNNISSFFFLDQAFPSLVKSALSNQNNCAVRLSEYESIETVISLSGMVNWVWVDMFRSFNLTYFKFRKLKEHNFKICLVSPELQSYGFNEIIKIKKEIKNNKIQVDAVCTKFPEIWLAN